ncbi:hypothetical protein GYMLUDRAFT_85274 [Collybiopsis luxurians FD-317 M1]|uniref:Uncharacterized protein n=1 Tax=Collybiopsis luxurians FD-317 M1 TaxID=944289 RepID=A0A0D0BB16_9AGAR|nr:hypothetical protein GYMLUDRAFT_85274 [Collybiopsis luxurians FD-317 M1]
MSSFSYILFGLATLILAVSVGYVLGQRNGEPKNTGEGGKLETNSEPAQKRHPTSASSYEAQTPPVVTMQPASSGKFFSYDHKISKNDSDAVVKQKAVAIDAVNMIVDHLQTPAKIPTQSISEPSVLEGASGVRFIGTRVGQGAFTAVAGDMVIGYDSDTSLEPSDTSEIADNTVAAPRALRGVRDMVVANSEVQGGAFTAVAGDARISLREQRREAPPLYSEANQGQRLVA